MNKKLMLVAAGVLAALVFAALPAVASAGEFEGDCENARATCEGTIDGLETRLVNSRGEGIVCSSVGGRAIQRNASSTGEAEFIFRGCRENVTIFRFSCNNTGTAGEIRTNRMVSHLIYLEPNTQARTTPGILLTNANVTFTCAGFARKTVTGNVIGHIENPQCNAFAAEHRVNFEEVAGSPGTQRWQQITTEGTRFDLVSNEDEPEGPGSIYKTSAQSGTGTITWRAGEHVKLTCHE
jgi:hypothetical protein